MTTSTFDHSTPLHVAKHSGKPAATVGGPDYRIFLRGVLASLRTGMAAARSFERLVASGHGSAAAAEMVEKRHFAAL